MGFVYHGHYLVWCEIGRTEFMRELGVRYADLERTGIRLVVAEASVRYRSPARYDDLIRVDTRLTRARSRTVTFEYDVVRVCESGDDELLATARTTLVAIDEGGTARTLPGDVVAAFRAAASEPTSLPP